MSITETIAPTPERKRQGRVEQFSAHVGAGESKGAERYRMIDGLEALARRNKIDDDAYNAGKAWIRDYDIGHRITGITPRYGAVRVQSGRDDDGVDRRVFHHNRFLGAAGTLAMPYEPLIAYLTNQPLAGQEGPASLEQIGIKLGGYAERKQAVAAGTMIVSMSLKTLARFYFPPAAQKNRRPP